MSELKIKLFYNKYYEPYRSECYFIYIQDNGMYLSIPGKNTFKVVNKPTFEVTPENVDSYAECRGFSLVLSETKDCVVTWSEDYKDPEKRLSVKDGLKQIQLQILESTRYPILDEYRFTHIVYVAINTLLSKI